MEKTNGKMMKASKKLAFGLLAAATLASTGAVSAVATNSVSANIVTTNRVKGSKGIYKESIIFTDVRNGKKIGSKTITGLHDGDSFDIANEVPEGWAYDFNDDDYMKYDKEDGDSLTINGGMDGGNWIDVRAKSEGGYLKSTNETYAALVYPIKASDVLGTIKVDYPAKYGIQIWTKDGKPVRYNAVEAKKTGHKVGDAKKLKGQSHWKVFGSVRNVKGTTYYNLGGDQYIDAAYTDMSFNMYQGK